MIYFTLTAGKVPKGISDENMNTLANIAKEANKMCTKKTSKSTAILNAWKVVKELPITLTDEDRGFGKPVPQNKNGDELEPAAEKAQEDANREQDEQEKLEEQEGLEEEITEEGEANGEEAESEEGKESGEEEEGEAGAGESEPDEEAEEEEVGEDEKEAGGEAGASGEGDNEEEVENMEDEPETDLDLSSMLDDLVNDNTKLPGDLAEDVSDAIIEKRADLTQLLSHLAKDSYYTIVAYTPEEDAMGAAKARSQTASAEEKLRRILQDFRLRRTRDYRGLMSGRVSSRRLYRAAYGDQRVFQRREKPEEIDMAVCLLMDLSGSMHYARPLIEQIVCAICDAFQKEKVEFIALGYSERESVVKIPRLYDREVGRVNLGLGDEWGMTPSYEGLAAAIAQLLRLTGKKQKVLFHFTDGEPNFGNSAIIPDLLNDARAKGITDIHVCLTRRESPSMERFDALYGEDVLPIENIDQLPEVVEQVLREKLKV